VDIKPASALEPLVIEERGAALSRKGEAIVANLPFHIAERELAQASKRLKWPSEELAARTEKRADGTGNVLLLMHAFENVTEVAIAFGRMGVSAEAVADEAVDAMRDYLGGGAPVGKHLADQLLLPMALGSGGRFVTAMPSSHTLSNIHVIRRFLDLRIDVVELDERRWRISVEGALCRRP
jgi:RNA 3'-terminal phosphate cyclase (ATP)